MKEDTSRKYSKTFTQPTLAQQHSKDEVDINNIMKRYVKTGVIDHVAKYQGQYCENTMQDYHESMNIVAKANSMFADLPSPVRKQFDNDPAEFLEFVNNPDNQDKLYDMGLTQSPPQSKSPPQSGNEPPPPSSLDQQANTQDEQAPAS